MAIPRQSLSVDLDSLFPGESLKIGDTQIIIRPLSILQIATISKQLTGFGKILAGDGVTWENYEDQQNLFKIASLLLVNFPSVLEEAANVNIEDLEQLPIDLIIEIVNEMPNSKAGSHLSNQLVRSGTSVSLNYGEAQSAESSRDFIHKMKVILKELRETFICLKLIHISKLYKMEEKIIIAKKENNELISIFVKSIQTAQRNQK